MRGFSSSLIHCSSHARVYSYYYRYFHISLQQIIAALAIGAKLESNSLRGEKKWEREEIGVVYTVTSNDQNPMRRKELVKFTAYLTFK